MKIENYLRVAFSQLESIFKQTIENDDRFGQTHHYASCVYEYSQAIQDNKDQEILKIVCGQLEAATLNLSVGLYRSVGYPKLVQR